MLDERQLARGVLEGLKDGNPFSWIVVALAIGAVTYAMWRLLRHEDPPSTRGDWVRLISIVAAGAGAIIGILGLVAEVYFAGQAGQHLALFGSAVFFLGFLIALVSLSVQVRARLRGRASGD